MNRPLNRLPLPSEASPVPAVAEPQAIVLDDSPPSSHIGALLHFEELGHENRRKGRPLSLAFIMMTVLSVVGSPFLMLLRIIFGS